MIVHTGEEQTSVRRFKKRRQGENRRAFRGCRRDNQIYLFLIGVGKRGAKQGAKQVSRARVFKQGCSQGKIEQCFSTRVKTGKRNLFVFDRCKSRDAAREKSNNVFLQGCEKGQRNLFVFDRCSRTGKGSQSCSQRKIEQFFYRV